MPSSSLAARLTPLSLVLAACSSAPIAPPQSLDGGRDAGRDAALDATRDAPRDARLDGKDGASASDAPGPIRVVFDLAADTTKPESFYSFPFPSDLRLNGAGAPDYAGFPTVTGNTLLGGMITLASQRKGFSTLAVGYFQFTGPLATIASMVDGGFDPVIIPADKSSNILLLDVDPASPDRGTLFPTVATTLPADGYTAANVLAVGARPGFVLAPKRQYAFVVRRELPDARGQLLAVDPTLATLAAGKTPTGTRGAAAAALYAPLFATLKTVGVAATDVAAATVFTTGDVVKDTADMSTQLVAKYPASITNLTVAETTPDAGSSYPRICELKGTVTLTQFQTGTPPFATAGGILAPGSDGLPAAQGTAKVPMAISLPTTGPMPAAGYPLVLYFHGSGGVSTEFVDRGPILVADGGETPGQGPAYVLAPFGFAMAGSALPQNPERVPGASETEYLQLNNLPSLLGTFQQGIIEQRMFLAALAKLTIPASVVMHGCPAVTAANPTVTAFKVDPGNFYSQGQSMGGMYTNLITAVEPSFRAAVPTGAGGFWTYFVFQSAFVNNANGLLELALGVQGEQLTFLHPAFSMIETGWEAVDPIVSVPRLSRNPLPGTKPRPIYEPIGQNDSYFSNDVYNAVALAYGHRQVGSVVWSGLQTALAEESLQGIVPYPASNDVADLDGGKYTGVVVQYNADPITGNGHYIYAQLDAVKYQYGCFLSSMLKTGTAVVPAPAPLTTPCP